MKNMSIRKELASLRPRNFSEEAVLVAASVAIAAAAYFLDGARVLAFGIVPSITIFAYATMRGVTFRKTPRLLSLAFVICIGLYALATAWVIFNPPA